MKNKVIEYVMNSPGNTNRAVLENLLDKAIGSGGMSVIDVGDFGRAVSGVSLPDDLNAAFEAAYAKGMPIIVKGTSEGVPIALVCHLMAMDDMGIPSFMTNVGPTIIFFTKRDDAWYGAGTVASTT